MKILLIRPRPHKDTIGLQSVMLCEPLELMTLADVLIRNHHEVTILDMLLEKRPLSYYIKRIRPDMVGITGYITHIDILKSYARTIKLIHKDIQVAVGGVHATVCPEDLKDVHIDYICRSDDEFYKLCHCQDLTKGLPYRQLPERYLKHYYYLFQDRCALIKTSYGCPYQCNFCFCKEIAPYQARNVEEVIKELLSIPQNEVYIVDDDFLFNAGRLKEFIKEVKTHQINKRYLVYGRADFISAHEALMEELAAIGVTAVIVGIEASSQEELDQYNKGTKLSDNENAIRILQKNGIECYATVILGVDWDQKDFKRLYRFIRRLKLVFVNLQPFTPMPGTDYFKQYNDQLIIPYDEHEKWDMAHLVIRPTKISVRQYYFQIIKLYYRITVTPKHVFYMCSRYGLFTTLKLSLGAAKITIQYLKKVIRG